MNTQWMKLLGLLFLALLLAACGPQQRAEDPEYSALKAQAEAQPDDTIAIGRVADAAQARYRATGQGHYRDDAIAYYQRYLEASPGHVGGNVALYAMLASRYVERVDANDMRQLREIFQRTPVLQTSPGVAPPSLVEALIYVGRRSRIVDVAPKMRDLLRKAIRENPRNVTSHLLLAETYEATGRPELAEAMIAQAYKAQPENTRVLIARAGVLYERAQASMCNLDRDAHREDVKQAIAALKAAAKANPKRAALFHDLSQMYEALGRPQLALFQAKRYNELQDDEESRWYLLDQYTAAKLFDEADKQGTENIQRDGRNAMVIGQLAMVANQRGDYEAAAKLFRDYRLLSRRPDVYFVVREAIVAEHLGREDQAQKALAAADVEPGTFDEALLNFHQGTLDEADFLGEADDACRLTEAHYFIARRALLDGDKAKARTEFGKVLDYQVPRYFEYVSAELRLQEL